VEHSADNKKELSAAQKATAAAESGLFTAEECMLMQPVNAILRDTRFCAALQANAEAERTREFCHHDLQHALDVARICLLLVQQQSWDPGYRVLCYAAGLLHDCCRHRLYQFQELDHAVLGAEFARKVMPDCGFDQQQTELVAEAIAAHRNPCAKGFGGLLYRADKLSRPCFACAAIAHCKRRPEAVLIW